MAFMLVAVFILFSMVGLVYVSITSSQIDSETKALRNQEAVESVKKLSGTAEFAFKSGGDCSSCIDLDKTLMLKERSQYKNFWNFDYLMIEKVYPNETERECTKTNYPECNKITIIDSNDKKIVTKTTFVTLARWDPNLGASGDFRYELGRIHISAKNIENG